VEAGYDWQQIQPPVGSGGIYRIYQCARTGIYGYVRGSGINPKRKVKKIIPYLCSAKGCKRKATARKPGLIGPRYIWVCEEHLHVDFARR